MLPRSATIFSEEHASQQDERATLTGDSGPQLGETRIESFVDLLTFRMFKRMEANRCAIVN